MTHEVYIGDRENPYFPVNQIKETSLALNNAVVGEALAYNEFSVDYWSAMYVTGLIYRPTDADGYLDTNTKVYSCKPVEYGDKLTHGTPVWYYVDDKLVGKYYVNTTARENEQEFTFSAVSAVGMLAEQKHSGGLYNGALFEDVANDIIGGAFPFSCSDEVKAQFVFGWLPEATKRDNLHQLLFALGVMLRQDENGDMFFTFPDTQTVKEIDPNKVYINGKISPTERVAKVRVTEHTYQRSANDITYTLFDNTSDGLTASHTRVVFSEAPCYDLTANGLTIEESGVNYAIVTGVGTLTGKAYTHIQKVYEQETGNTGDAVKAFDEQTLVSVANSSNVLHRMADYYSTAEVISESIQMDGELTGDLVEVMTPYKDVVNAYISQMTIKGLATAKAECQFVKDYTPSFLGNNFHASETYTSSGTYYIAKKGLIMLTLIGGGQGGQRGYNGQDGEAGNMRTSGKGGAGGLGGLGGHGGKVCAVVLDLGQENRLHRTVINLGAGGFGGTTEGAQGLNGSPTTVTIQDNTYSSNNGQIAPYGVMDVFSGNVYATAGRNGISGGKGGDASDLMTEAVNGESVGSAQGGNGTLGGEGTYGSYAGGAGGGAARYVNGGDAGQGDAGTRSRPSRGGKGGNGANSMRGGNGYSHTGNGGEASDGAGGGGGGGGATYYNGWAGTAQGGTGGASGVGGDGGSGLVILYY